MQLQERFVSQIYVPTAAFLGIAKFNLLTRQDILYELQSLLGKEEAV